MIVGRGPSGRILISTSEEIGIIEEWVVVVAMGEVKVRGRKRDEAEA
jgi:hypothetical protein